MIGTNRNASLPCLAMKTRGVVAFASDILGLPWLSSDRTDRGVAGNHAAKVKGDGQSKDGGWYLPWIQNFSA